MKTYTVESPIKHDGKEYAAGDIIDLSEKDASDLVEIGAVSESAAANTPADEAERLSAVVAAIGMLDKADAVQWLKNGAPKTEAIAAITGWAVSATERDTAWATFNVAAG